MSPIHRLCRSRALFRLCAALFPLLAACGEGEARRPNVLLVSIDTLRADHLSAWGYHRETSPRIDELCAEGVRCADAVSTTSWTLPAHLSMLTGLAVSAHGMCDDRLLELAVQQKAPLPLHGTFLAELLSARNYETAGFYSWVYLEPRFGFDAGFDVYERIGETVYTHPEWKPRFDALRERGAQGDTAAVDELRRWKEESPELFDMQRPTSGEAVDAALAWLDARRGEDPWFLFVHLFDVHDDYLPPPPFDELFDPGYEGPIDGHRISAPDSPFRGDMPRADLDHVIALYDGEIAWVDSQVGRLLDQLEVMGVDEDTLVVLTSDHGEEFYEHGNKTHRHSLYVESVHVPLVFRLPGRIEAGLTIEETTGIVDIVPTVCELVNVPAPPGISGRSLVAALEGEGSHPPRAYVTELLVFPEEGWTPTRHVGVRTPDRFELHVRAPGAPLLHQGFDRDADPREATPQPALEVSGDPFGSGVREALAEERGYSVFRATGASALTETDQQALGAMGYAQAPTEPAEGADIGRERLCLDGCVWPDG